MQLAKQMTESDRETEEVNFCKCFYLLETALNSEAFKKWDGERHVGPFFISGFDAIAHGVAKNLENIVNKTDAESWIQERVREMWQHDIFTKYSVQGVRGTTSLKHLLPFGEEFFKP